MTTPDPVVPVSALKALSEQLIKQQGRASNTGYWSAMDAYDDAIERIDALIASAQEDQPDVSPKDLRVEDSPYESSENSETTPASDSNQRGDEADDADMPGLRAPQRAAPDIHRGSLEGDQGYAGFADATGRSRPGGPATGDGEEAMPLRNWPMPRRVVPARWLQPAWAGFLWQVSMLSLAISHLSTPRPAPTPQEGREKP
jgi:hypothetical protein